MDLQKMMDSFSTGMRSTRSDYHLTLGGLIKKLGSLSDEKFVVFSSGENVGKEMSYRGYYSDLSFETQEKSKTVKQFKKQCENALGNTYTGYKGGDFRMDKNTPLWKAEYSWCGEAIMEIIENDQNVVLVCKKVED